MYYSIVDYQEIWGYRIHPGMAGKLQVSEITPWEVRWPGHHVALPLTGPCLSTTLIHPTVGTIKNLDAPMLECGPDCLLRARPLTQAVHFLFSRNNKVNMMGAGRPIVLFPFVIAKKSSVLSAVCTPRLSFGQTTFQRARGYGLKKCTNISWWHGFPPVAMRRVCACAWRLQS